MSLLRTYRRLRRVRRDQWLTSTELEHLQNHRLQAMIQHAYRHVAYYRQLIQRTGARPDDISTARDLQRLPITTKETLHSVPLRHRLADNLGHAGLVSAHTSGSTGRPLDVYFQRHPQLDQRLLWYRLLLSESLSPRDRILRIFGDEPQQRRPDILDKLGLFRRRQISSFRPLEEQAAYLRAYDPGVIIGEPSALYLLAQYVEEHGTTLAALKLILSSTEVLHDHMRRCMRRAFRVPVYDVYVSLELGIIAFECARHQGYHINVDYVIPEIVPPADEPDASWGGFVGTNLFNFAMPFIRYQTGDICGTVSGGCTCGRHLPLMGPVQGRDNDLLVMLDGRKVSSGRIVHAVHHSAVGVREFALEQISPRRLLVRVVPGTAFRHSVIRRMVTELHALLPEVHVDVRTVNALPRDPSGKLRVFRSRVGSAAQSPTGSRS